MERVWYPVFDPQTMKQELVMDTISVDELYDEHPVIY